MRHPSDGTLRRLLDEPAGVPDADRRHIADCPTCLRDLDDVRKPAVAAVSAAVLFTGAGVAAANDWLPIFSTQRVDPIEVSSADLVQVPDLSAYGDLQITQEPDTQQVP